LNLKSEEKTVSSLAFQMSQLAPLRRAPRSPPPPTPCSAAGSQWGSAG
jgi:hypothetical protein